MKPLVGMTQGRLVSSADGRLQSFPQGRWKEELALAREVGFDYIEWMAERQRNDANPIWSDDGVAAIREACEVHGLLFYSVVNDYALDHGLTAGPDAVDQTLHLVTRAAKLGVQKLVLPLYEASEIAHRPHEPFVAPLRRIADHAKRAGVHVCLETSAPVTVVLELQQSVDRSNVSLCFDTGNRIAEGQDIYGDIERLGPQIAHVHVKDKDANGLNVFLGTGCVDFRRVFESLALSGYEEALTFETPRGRDPVATARYHKSVVDFFLHEVSGDGS